MNNMKIIQHMFVVVRKSVWSPWGIIPFCKNWHSLLCYGSKLSVCLIWLQCGHSQTTRNSYCNCKPLEWWGSTYLSLPHAVARCCISFADMRKIKSFLWGLIFSKDLWLTKSLGLIIPVGPTGGTKLTQSTISQNQLARKCTHSCGHVTVCVSFVEHVNQLYMDCISNHIQYFVLQHAGSLGLVYVSGTLLGNLSTAKSLEPVAGWSCYVIIHLHHNFQSVVFLTIFLYKIFIIYCYFYLLPGIFLFNATSGVSRWRNCGSAAVCPESTEFPVQSSCNEDFFCPVCI